jgi:hypothetical protein
MIIEITDSTTPMLSVIAQVSRDVAFEHMSKIGDAVRKNAKNQMASPKNRHHWFYRISNNNKRYPYKDENETKELGFRTKADGSAILPDSMGNMITSNLMEESGILVVGGRNKRKKVVFRREGLIVGYGSLPAISKHTQSIIHKLDEGLRNEYHGWGPAGSQKESMKRFRKAKYRRTRFMMKAFSDSVPYMKQELTTGYERTIGKAVNRVQVTLKPSKKVVL